MKLYRWKSNLMAAYATGFIVVMAESIDQAREKVWDQWKPFEEGPTEDSYLVMLKDLNDSEELEEKLEERRAELRNDLAQTPEIVDSGVLFFRGSD